MFHNVLYIDDESKSTSSDSDSIPLDPDVEMDIEQQLQLNHKVIQTKYAAYVDCIRSILEEKGVTAKQLSAYLLYLTASTSTEDERKLQLLSDMKTELQKAELVVDVIISLSTQYASFLDYDIFERILKRFAPNKAHEDLNYPNDLKIYIEMHKVEEFVKLYPKLNNPKLQKIHSTSKLIDIKINIKPTATLSTLKEITSIVANILGLRPSALRLHGIKKGNTPYASIHSRLYLYQRNQVQHKPERKISKSINFVAKM